MKMSKAGFYPGQKGYTMTGVLFVSALIIFFTYCGMRIFPLVYQASVITRTLRELAEVPGSGKIKAPEFRRRFLDKTELENLDSFNTGNMNEALSVVRQENNLFMVMQYEARQPLFGNLWLLYDYEKRFLLKK